MTETKRSLAFIHTSPAAIGPLMQFYAEAAPEFEITNLLDDGLLRLLAAAVENLQRKDVSAVVLAQVSMARTLPLIEPGARVPVLTSLHTSLEAIREALHFSN